MTKCIILLVAAACAVVAADNWDKVKAIRSGTEVRVYKKGTAQPVLAKFDEARDESVVVVVKNEQVAIPRDIIDRLDARPDKGSRVTTETKTKTEPPDTRPAPMGSRPATGNTSYSNNVSIGSKPDFETVYRRPAPAPKKADEKK